MLCKSDSLVAPLNWSRPTCNFIVRFIKHVLGSRCERPRGHSWECKLGWIPLDINHLRYKVLKGILWSFQIFKTMFDLFGARIIIFVATVLGTVLTSICGKPAFLRSLLAKSSRASSSGSSVSSESLASSPQIFKVTEEKWNTWEIYNICSNTFCFQILKNKHKHSIQNEHYTNPINLRNHGLQVWGDLLPSLFSFPPHHPTENVSYLVPPAKVVAPAGMEP